MKGLWIATIALLSSGIAFAQNNNNSNVTVNGEKALNKDFSVYKTYYWATPSAQAQAGNQNRSMSQGRNSRKGSSATTTSSSNSSMGAFNGKVQSAINFAMEGRGYKPSSNMPDLLVNFEVLDQPTTLKGATGYTTIDNGTQEIRQPEDTTSFKVEKGTLLISLIDRKTGQQVWHGFASGLMDPNSTAWREDKINEAVTLIFNQYPARADNLENNR